MTNVFNKFTELATWHLTCKRSPDRCCSLSTTQIPLLQRKTTTQNGVDRRKSKNTSVYQRLPQDLEYGHLIGMIQAQRTTGGVCYHEFQTLVCVVNAPLCGYVTLF